MNINELAKSIYQQNVEAGWWDNPDRCIFECLQLVSTEIAEATEGERKNLMDDKLPHRKMGEVELADALIRILDIGGKMGWDYTDEFALDLMAHTGSSIGKQHLACNMAIASLATAIEYDLPGRVNSAYSILINTIVHVGFLNGYDIESALHEKREFNRTRADHKRENRALEHGKKF